ncbi:MAG: DUF3795 domain-containing protein [Eubacteriales bacterium]|nr:DUF3795 domain-containing protein [Eubacteriales bacterium]
MKQYCYPMELVEKIKLGKKTATGVFKELLDKEELGDFLALNGQIVEVVDEIGNVHCRIRIIDCFEVNVANPPLEVAIKECFDSIEAWQADCKEYWTDECPDQEWNENTVMLMQNFELVLVGMCGFVCDECPAYSKNITDDKDRNEVSRKWQELFDYDIEPEKIRCDGCYKVRIEGRELLHGDCEYKACAEKKKLERCSQCEEYMCTKLFEFVNAYKELSQSSNITREDFEKYFKAHCSII